ncbi:hypothetical protein GCM10023189_01390 [Nibrella saemangeumensis]|uniref:Phosphate-selective porin O and P n=1 Tax=Nibrella saemangeumensis TaxID=1084526 RepID=A0ABP8M8F2_9BACT
MGHVQNKRLRTAFLLLWLFSAFPALAQRTQLRGFFDFVTYYQNNRVGFTLGEQTLFITSELNDRFSFLGETSFRVSPQSPTGFNVAVERLVIKYNYYGNHNILVGRHHPPVNYWNDVYHRGRIFYPTIEWPLLFNAGIIPLRGTGISFQGMNLGSLRFGYDLMVTNGLGSGDIIDNDRFKAVTASVHIKPVQELKVMASYYHDVISQGAIVNDRPIRQQVTQNLLTGSVSYFGKKFELVAEGTSANNQSDSTGGRNTLASYVYAGVRVAPKFIPYIRFDNIRYSTGEVFYFKDNTTSFVAGLRYEISYLTVVKLEYQTRNSEVSGSSDALKAQLAIGF